MSGLQHAEHDIAIVGAAGRFPGASDLEQFWANISQGVESIRHFSDDELRGFGVPEESLRDPSFVRAAAIIDGADRFDHEFWGYSPREAQLMDPQQRVFLEVGWHALEHAGYNPHGYDGLIGVYAGMGMSTYLLFNLIGNPALTGADTTVAMLGNDKDFLSTRASYHLNLRGPSVTVQSGCSTSLVATHLACDALLSFQCDMALAGGSTIAVPQRTGYHFVPGGTASPDGRCRAFDADAAGTLFGSGVGIVVLKRMADALAAGDTIYAVIKGSAVNNDGSHKVGFTAPSVEGQAEVIVRAQHVADVDPVTIGYVEAHGTATKLGDPMEVTALTRAFRASTRERNFCALGSVKTNVGHLDTAAGVTGLIKTMLALQHGKLPPSLHFTRPNPGIDFADSPFYVNTELTDWPAKLYPRRAGVSAFGFGGTNVHMVLEQAPPAAPDVADERPQLLVLSARTEAALDAASDRLVDHLRDHPEQPLSDVAFTLQRGRVRFGYRRSVVVRDRQEAVAALTSRPRPPIRTRADGRQNSEVAFMFAGLGDQYAGMAEGLYQTAGVFRAALDRCAEGLRPHLGLDLREVLYPAGRPASGEGASFDLRAMLKGAPGDTAIQRTTVAHPALFAVEYALAQQWLAWGVRPVALIGHSLGEYVAATIAGVFQLEDALMLVAKRAELIDALPSGAMLAVPMGVERAREFLLGSLSIALVNGPALTVVAGAADDIHALEGHLRALGVSSRRLRADRAFHTSAMAPVVAPLTDLVSQARLTPPEVPFVSNVSGTWITAAEATDPGYWGRHTMHTVEFAGGMRELCRGRDLALVEIGPGQSLSALAGDGVAAQPDAHHAVIVPSLRPWYDRRQPDDVFLVDALGQLWLAGAPIDWEKVHAPRKPRRVALPTYPFARHRSWLDPPSQPGTGTGVRQASGPRPALDDWFLVPTWRSTSPPAHRACGEWSGDVDWLVLSDGSALARALVRRLDAEGRSVTVVEPGAGFVALDHDRYRLDPATAAHYVTLCGHLERDGRAPTRVVHLWSLDQQDAGTPDVDDDLRRGFYSLSYLARALARMSTVELLSLWLVSDRVLSVEGADVVRPAKTTMLGPAKCIPQEYERLSVRFVDVSGAGEPAARTAERLLDIMADEPNERIIACRGRRQWVEDFSPTTPSPSRPSLRPRGVYLITGGLGQIGLDLAAHLAERVEARLALITRGPFPPAPQWERWLAGHDEDDATSRRIRRLQQIVRTGSEVIVLSADVADVEQLRGAVAETLDRFGVVHGVVHAAGVGGVRAFGLIDELTPGTAVAQFRPKVQGCLRLDDVLGDMPLDFRLLLSSNAALFGGIGAATYTACNLFVDAFADQRAAADGHRWLSVNLEEWLAADAAHQYQVSFTRYGITPAEGVRAVERLLDEGRSGRVVLITGDLVERLDRWIVNPAAARRARVGTIGRQPRPALSTSYAAPEGDREQAIAEIWQEVLGIEQVGREDNFYELGGHSLLATQIVARVRTALAVDVSMLSLLAAPTVVGFAGQLTDGGGSAGRSHEVPLVPVPRQGESQPSYAQERFWFLDQLAPGNPFYNIPDVVRIEGPLDVDLLSRSINGIIARHESLRTTLITVNGEPAQHVAESLKITIGRQDLTSLPDGARHERLTELALSEARAPFDLAAGPLIRATVVGLADDEHALLLTMHHSVSDAWSMGVFIRELAEFYAAQRERREVVLDPLPLQYADFATWQRQNLHGETLERLLTYWRGELAGAPPLLALPTDHPRPPVQTFRGATHPIELPPDLVRTLHRIGSGRNCTLFMTLLAAFTCLLHHQSGERDLVVGSPIAGRTQRQLEDIIGAFVNMLPLRTRIDPQASFLELLAQVRAVTLGAYAHQELPFEVLVENLQPVRSLSHGPVFQVVFVLQNAPLPELVLSDLRLSPMPMEATTAKFDLMFTLRETGEGVTGIIEYSTDLFTRQTINRLGRQFHTLLRRIADRPQDSVAALGAMPVEEQATVLGTWSNGEARKWGDTSIPHLVAQRAAATPDKDAVVGAYASTRGFTFGELERLSNQVAWYLTKRGIGRGCQVGVHLERSPETIVALVGIVKAGCAYVPLDPTYPRAWLQHMATDARLDLLVTRRDSAIPVAAGGAAMITLEELWDACADQPAWAPPCLVDDSDPAYVIYTSGSTGTPKGVVGLHGGMRNRLAWMWERYPFAPDEVHCQKTSLNFLDSFWEIFGPMCQGITTVVFPQRAVADPEEFVRLLGEHGVTRVVVVPSLLQAVLEFNPGLADLLPSLRLWVTSGEALTPQLARAFFAALPGRCLLNLYGSSEVAADVTWHEVTADDAAADHVPIGRPIANVSVYLLDAGLRPVAPGADGEIYVGGVAPGHGYLRRPGLTASRFVPDPFASTPGGRLYRTGDRGRFAADGVIEYLGRRDEQVKVRGFRIELAEVESTLRRHRDVAGAVVVQHRQALVAYVVPEPGRDPQPDALRSDLLGRLPAYMVPASLVLLPALPLTPSGKLDRSALPPPEVVRRADLVAPRTPVESAIAGLWRTVLDTTQDIGVHDPFFSMGGHSLLATRLVMRVREAFDVDLPLSAFFEAPTIAGMAAHLVGRPERKAGVEKRAELLLMLADLSDEDVERMLGGETGAGGAGS
ncbi:amino acid adenylation domain-containing protein [Plantactinospora sp. ZYX-F-223]|uniref:non-ribosomal peptide synthetase/type I polyketide synthase n=1 Tax=Plantactinospora sp. ZYX-F-223 TaxID=3144103 RepID=UPI0031FC5826